MPGQCGVVEPLDGEPVGLRQVTHGGRDVEEVDEVAVRGFLAQAIDGGAECVLLAAYGVVEGEGGLQERGEPGESCDVELGAQDGGAVGDVAVGAGVAYEAGDLGEQGGRALVERLQEPVGEGEFVVGAVRVRPGGGQGEAGLGDGPFAGGVVLFGLGPRLFEGSDGAGEVALGQWMSPGREASPVGALRAQLAEPSTSRSFAVACSAAQGCGKANCYPTLRDAVNA
ncbi:hypothetical protein [Streptomyces sp. NPDC046727]|uniref:hypothetical protein n=1 Tax=Streptomyces sp. NPDC046727 TaxID=3155373 RepID=UPI0033CA8411